MDSIATRTTTGDYAKSLVAAIGNGNRQSTYVASKATSMVYLLGFDAATVPSNGAKPTFPPIPIPAGPAHYETDTRLDFKVGLVFAASSTAGTLTLISGNDVWITAEVQQ